MRTYRVESFGPPENMNLEELPDPKPGPQQVVIRVEVAGVNFSDVIAVAGDYPRVTRTPFYPGNEVAGTIESIGEGASGFTIGQRVMALTFSGGYSTHMAINASEVVPVPDDVSLEHSVAVLVQGLTANFLLEHGNVGAGSSVLIASAGGGVGSLAVQLAKKRGATNIIGLASARRHARIVELGGSHAVDYNEDGWSKKVLALTGGEGVDCYLDAQGDLSGEGFEALAVGSRWMIFGSQAGSEASLAPERLGQIVLKNITLRGYGVNFDFSRLRETVLALMQLVVSDELKISIQRFPFLDAARVHSKILDRETVGKVVLTM